jgi:hypothetical protein
MSLLRCPHPSHGARLVPLKSNYEKVLECEDSHRFYRREEGGAQILVDLISGCSYGPETFAGSESATAPTLNFLVDVPRTVGTLDFDRLSLSAAEWKIMSKIDGRNTVEEIRLLSGMKADEADRILRRFIEAGLVEICGRG